MKSMVLTNDVIFIKFLFFADFPDLSDFITTLQLTSGMISFTVKY